MNDNSNLEELKSTIVYDFIFAGYGAAASLLLLELHRKNLLSKKKILIVDPAIKSKNDKTFCFWANDEDPIVQNLKNLIKHSWTDIILQNSEINSIAPLKYNHISSIDLYNQVYAIEKMNVWERVIAPVESIGRDQFGSYVRINNEVIRGGKIFDSRTPKYQKANKGETHIFQSFVGWEIELDNDIKNQNACRLMDFSVDQTSFTQFMYVLPFSSRKVLVELTRFGREILNEQEAEKYLEKYISLHFGNFIKNFVEIGCIPMSTCKIENEIIEDVELIGARSYKVKPSTGYAFKNMYYHANEIANRIENLKKKREVKVLSKKKLSKRFVFYDSLLLSILENKPQMGKKIFTDLFKGVEITKVLKFLDEKTSLKDDIMIFLKLPWMTFISALFVKIKNNSSLRPFVLLLITLILLSLGKNTLPQTIFGFSLFTIGLITVGIPHGAVDHLLETGNWNKKKAPRFVLIYLFQGAVMAAIWYLFPQLALVIFLIYSAWHFGQADGKIWGFSQIFSFIWGIFVLFYILGTHLDETNLITSLIGNVNIPISCPIWMVAPLIVISLVKKKSSFCITLIWLLLASQIPLLFAFGLYFIGQHSMTSWNHITSHLNLSNRKIWMYSLPFHLGAWIFLFLFFFITQTNLEIDQYNMKQWGNFFIFIACISFPHAITMNSLYQNKFK